MNARWPNTIALWLLTGLLCCPTAVLSAQPGSSAEIGQARYRVTLRATQTADHSLILAVSAPLVLGHTNIASTRSTVPAENYPALPSFTAVLTQTDSAGGYQLVTRVVVRESLRNKKGKLKVSQRNIGSLLPIRLSETQNASAVGDPITLEWQVERR